MKKISSEKRKLLRCLVRSSHFVKSFYGSRSNPSHKFRSSEAFEPTNQSNCVFSLTKTFTAQNHTCIRYSRESYFKCLSAQSQTSNVIQPRVILQTFYSPESHFYHSTAQIILLTLYSPESYLQSFTAQYLVQLGTLSHFTTYARANCAITLSLKGTYRSYIDNPI